MDNLPEMQALQLRESFSFSNDGVGMCHLQYLELYKPFHQLIGHNIGVLTNAPLNGDVRLYKEGRAIECEVVSSTLTHKPYTAVSGKNGETYYTALRVVSVYAVHVYFDHDPDPYKPDPEVKIPVVYVRNQVSSYQQLVSA